MRLLPQRNDHDDGGIARCQSRSDRQGNFRSFALQSLPLRRAFRNSRRRQTRRQLEAWMKDLQRRGLTRADILARPPPLAGGRASERVTDVATADPECLEPFVAVEASGMVTAFNGHVDLGTGIRTA